jgi:hypothetical protein
MKINLGNLDILHFVSFNASNKQFLSIGYSPTSQSKLKPLSAGPQCWNFHYSLNPRFCLAIVTIGSQPRPRFTETTSHQAVEIITTKEKRMLIKKNVSRAPGASLVAIISMAVQPLGAQTPPDEARLQKLKFDFPRIAYFQLAPTLYNYTGDGNTFNVHFSGDPGGNQTGINSLLVFDIPAEIGWKVGKIPMRIFGDFATNFEADDRATAAWHPGKGGDRYAYEIGLGVGQLKKKHDWQIDAWWQHQDQYALDPNLVDSDLFNSTLNLEGVAVRAGYMLADAVVFNLTWAYAWRIDGSIGTGGIGDNISINPVDQYQIFQADLSFKF